MPRNLIICCDGTDNQFGSQNSNVIRLAQSLSRDPERQTLYYDPGVGTLPDPPIWNPLVYLKTKAGKLADRMIAWGLERNIEEAYAYLMDYWSAGDQVYLFGFSRGAYTVRVLAGMLHVLGLLPAGNHNLLPYLMRLYKSIRGRDRHYWRLCADFRATFARNSGQRGKRFAVHFVGVWDTVATVGWLWNPRAYPYTRSNPSIRIVRHAVSIDERRAFFRQNLFAKRPNQDVVEMWFPGDHSDVGGGYPESCGGLWRIPFAWMVENACATGLLIDKQRLDSVLRKSPQPAEPWTEPQHSLLSKWWLAEFVPKRQWDWSASAVKWRCGRFGHRFVPKRSLLHQSALKRLRAADLDYDPPNLSDSFREHVRRLPDPSESQPAF